MAGLRQDTVRTVVLLAYIALGMALNARAAFSSGELYDRPVLTIDPGMHTADILSADTDRNARLIATGSFDKTLRIWDASTGSLRLTVHPPFGPQQLGQVYSVAVAPSGNTIAIGGWTFNNEIYLIDPVNGTIISSIVGMSNIVARLAFSPDGRYLVAGSLGLSVFDRTKNWAEIAKDDDFSDLVNGISFADDGRLVISTQDGHVRLYDAQFHRGVDSRPYGNSDITSVAFRPDGSLIAIGSTKYPCISILDGHTLKQTDGPDPKEAPLSGDGAIIAWAKGGKTLVLSSDSTVMLEGTAGTIVTCENSGRGPCREVIAPVGSRVSSIMATSKGDLIVVGVSKPYLGMFDNTFRLRWEHRSRVAEYPGPNTIRVNEKGDKVEFRFQPNPQVVQFSLGELSIVDRPRWSTESPSHDDSNDGIILDWGKQLVVDGVPIVFPREERPFAVAQFPNGKEFVVGTTTTIQAFGRDRLRRWSRTLSDATRDIKVSGDGRLVVAAIEDGTIRWFRAEDGVELVAFMPLAKSGSPAHANGAAALDWVVWTPDGFYSSTKDATNVLQWLSNQGEKSQAIIVPVSSIAALNRPDVIKALADVRDIRLALGDSDLRSVQENIQIATKSESLPGARLYAVGVGISDFGPGTTKLNLQYADRDASDFLDKLYKTQGKSGGLYTEVIPMLLQNGDASKETIFQTLDIVKDDLRRGDNNDVVVLLFSTHGAKIDGDLYLLPFGVNAFSNATIEASAIPASQLESKIAGIAQYGLVLVLLDACRSGAFTNGGTKLASDSNAMRSLFTTAGVVVLTSSSGTEDSLEDPKWQHGAFTEVLLEELSGKISPKPGSTVSIGVLANDLATTLPVLTNGAQHLGASPDFTRLATPIFLIK
jgi:WD40 repeat protein